MEYRTNCKNCGAPLHYDKTNYGKVSECRYCGTEYHIDLLGRIEEYKIKIEFMGEVRDYYIGSWSVESLPLLEFIGLDGKRFIDTPKYKSKLELIEF